MDKKKKEAKVSFKTPQVVPVVEEENTVELPEIHPNMIQPFSLVLGLGSVRSGKTVLINNLLLRSREDGFLDVKEVNKGIERVEYTGEMHLSGLHTSGKYDYFMEFEALFWKGDLKEIKLANWEKNDNEERLKKQKELEHRFKQAYDKKSSGFRTICNKAVKLPFSIIKYLFALGYRIAHKVESWISF
mgnify:CR=1 FL=1